MSIKRMCTKFKVHTATNKVSVLYIIDNSHGYRVTWNITDKRITRREVIDSINEKNYQERINNGNGYHNFFIPLKTSTRDYTKLYETFFQFLEAYKNEGHTVTEQMERMTKNFSLISTIAINNSLKANEKYTNK